jgi:hypothetical protein
LLSRKRSVRDSGNDTTSTLEIRVFCDKILESARMPTTHTSSPEISGLVSSVAARTGVSPIDFGS